MIPLVVLLLDTSTRNNNVYGLSTGYYNADHNTSYIYIYIYLENINNKQYGQY